MGMTIEEARTALGKERKYALHENKQAFDIAMNTMRKYQQLRADYENRLKADMVAMLEEISDKFDEQYYVNRHKLHDDSLNVGLEQGQQIIQQKINALKGKQT